MSKSINPNEVQGYKDRGYRIVKSGGKFYAYPKPAKKTRTSNSINQNEVQAYRDRGFRVVKSGSKFYAYEKPALKRFTSGISFTTTEGKTRNVTSRTTLKTKEGKLNMAALRAITVSRGIDTMDLMDAVNELHMEGKKVNWKSVQALLVNSKVGRFLINVGIDIDELVADCQMECPDVDRAYVLDAAHWAQTTAYKVKSPLTLPNGAKVHFEWDYDNGSTYYIEGANNGN